MAATGHDHYPLEDFTNKRDWHIYYVYNDPEFIADVKGLKKANNGDIQAGDKASEAVATKHGITVGDINLGKYIHYHPTVSNGLGLVNRPLLVAF